MSGKGWKKSETDNKSDCRKNLHSPFHVGTRRTTLIFEIFFPYESSFVDIYIFVQVKKVAKSWALFAKRHDHLTHFISQIWLLYWHRTWSSMRTKKGVSKKKNQWITSIRSVKCVFLGTQTLSLPFFCLLRVHQATRIRRIFCTYCTYSA